MVGSEKKKSPGLMVIEQTNHGTCNFLLNLFWSRFVNGYQWVIPQMVNGVSKYKNIV